MPAYDGVGIIVRDGAEQRCAFKCSGKQGVVGIDRLVGV
jgi:hypothetical protein